MIEQRGKNRRRIEMRKTHEINRAAHADQRRRGQVADHTVIFYWLIIHRHFPDLPIRGQNRIFTLFHRAMVVIAR